MWDVDRRGRMFRPGRVFPKLRVWLPRPREMVYTDIEFFIYHDGSIGFNRAGNWYSDIWDAVGELSTGEVDANDRTVYQGDVVRNESGRICLVEWCSTWQMCGFDLTALNAKGVVSRSRPFDWHEWTVVGNLHEHGLKAIVDKYDSPVTTP